MSGDSTRRRALICGVSGQDGAYLARLLLKKGYEVWGTSRDAEGTRFEGLERLGVRERVRLLSMRPIDPNSVRQVVETVRPHEIYNLAGQSSVGLSFEQPLLAMESISIGILNLLEAIRAVDASIRLYNAGSCECFGDTGGKAANEATPFNPRSPYAVAKAAAFWQVAVYRESYGLFACTGILFNHESPLRQERFVSRKIVSTARRIAEGSGEQLRLGNLAIRRDWGWAGEYVDAMWRMLNHSTAQDFVIATGVTQSLEEFTAAVFAEAGLDWRRHVVTDRGLFRPLEPLEIRGDPDKARKLLSWVAECTGVEVAKRLFRAESGQLLKDSRGEVDV